MVQDTNYLQQQVLFWDAIMYALAFLMIELLPRPGCEINNQIYEYVQSVRAYGAVINRETTRKRKVG
jgi:hypothetical protein